MEDRWLQKAKRLHAIASTGLNFAQSAFDRERYQEIAAIAGEMLADLGNVPLGRIADLVPDFAQGYATPKIDVRAAVIRDDRILLLIDAGSEPTDWSLPPTPGSWVEQFSSALGSQLNDDGTYRTPGRSVVVFVEAVD